MAAYNDKSVVTELNVGTGQSGNTQNIVISRPGVSTSGHILIVHLFINYGSSTLSGLTLASGWTQLWDTWQSTSGDHWVVAWKVDGGSEPATFTFSYTADTEYVFANGQIFRYSATNGLLDGYNSGDETTTEDHVAPSISATYTNDLMVVSAVEDSFSFASCTGFTERHDDLSSAFKVYDKALSASGATGTATVVTASAGNGRAGTILIQDTSPAGGAGNKRRYTLTTLGVG